MKLVAAAVALIAVPAILLVAALLLQRRVLFPAPPALPPPASGTAEVIRLQVESASVEALLLTATTGTTVPSPLIIFTHGNGELADYWVDEFEAVRNEGWSVLLLEYPGYGRSSGSPSERSILAAAAAAYDWASGSPAIDVTRIVPWGRSLGGGPAAWLAAHRPVAGLILESTFTSTRPLAARFLLPGFLIRDPFENLQALAGYRRPLLVLHGERDTLVPIAEGRALAAAVPGAQLHELPCGHNDCERPWPVIRGFLTKVQSSPGRA